MLSALLPAPSCSPMIDLLKHLISTPSLSRNESDTADILLDYLETAGAAPRKHYNNVWCVSDGFDSDLPTLMLNSHHDTVKPAKGWTRDPFIPTVEGDCLYGLGSNDAGASVVTLITTFLNLRNKHLPFNLLLAITAEEEVGGENGMRAFLPHLKEHGITPDCVIVGEPTGMQAAVAERGLVVLDCTTKGVAGHAARKEGVNAIYLAMEDIQRVCNYDFGKESEVLGPIGVTVTQILAGTQHNVVPDLCTWVADVRTTDTFTNQKTTEMLQQAATHSTLVPRSTRVQASVIPESHPLVQAVLKAGRTTFVSPTTSDMSLMHGLPSLKIGPGRSERSHKADEYIALGELNEAIDIYKKIIENIFL